MMRPTLLFIGSSACYQEELIYCPSLKGRAYSAMNQAVHISSNNNPFFGEFDVLQFEPSSKAVIFGQVPHCLLVMYLNIYSCKICHRTRN